MSLSWRALPWALNLSSLLPVTSCHFILFGPLYRPYLSESISSIYLFTYIVSVFSSLDNLILTLILTLISLVHYYMYPQTQSRCLAHCRYLRDSCWMYACMNEYMGWQRRSPIFSTSSQTRGSAGKEQRLSVSPSPLLSQCLCIFWLHALDPLLLSGVCSPYWRALLTIRNHVDPPFTYVWGVKGIFQHSFLLCPKYWNVFY